MMFSELNYIICLLFEKWRALSYIEYILLHVQIPVQVQFIYSDHTIDGIWGSKHLLYNVTNNVRGQQKRKQKIGKKSVQINIVRFP